MQGLLSKIIWFKGDIIKDVCQIMDLASKIFEPHFIILRISIHRWLLFTGLFSVLSSLIFHAWGPPQESKNFVCPGSIRSIDSSIELSALITNMIFLRSQTGIILSESHRILVKNGWNWVAWVVLEQKSFIRHRVSS